MAEDDDARQAVPPLPFVPDRLGQDGEADLSVGADGVQLVSFPGAVEVYLSIEEDEVDGQAVGIAVLAYDGKDAALRGFQDGEAFLLRSGLLESSQWSEICHTCLNYR